MQLNNTEQIPDIAKRTNFSIFELPEDMDFSSFFPNAYHLSTEDRAKHISIEQIKTLTQITANKQGNDFFVVIEQPERMTSEASAAFLKSLEEPGEHVHYVFLTNKASSLLPTIRSRANYYYLPESKKIKDAPKYPSKTIELAKAYISASPNKLPEIVDKILKINKESTRDGALEVLAASIELSYKSYLITGNKTFIVKLEKLLIAEDAIKKNGHAKLQLIANMV